MVTSTVYCQMHSALSDIIHVTGLCLHVHCDTQYTFCCCFLFVCSDESEQPQCSAASHFLRVLGARGAKGRVTPGWLDVSCHQRAQVVIDIDHQQLQKICFNKQPRLHHWHALRPTHLSCPSPETSASQSRIIILPSNDFGVTIISKLLIATDTALFQDTASVAESEGWGKEGKGGGILLQAGTP